jgi:hypothetical protein
MAYHPGHEAVVLFGGADERRVLADLWAWDGRDWRCLSGGGPPPRTFPALAYDGASERLVLFGGNRVLFGTEADTASFLDDMWTWDGEAWHRYDGATPSARAEPAVAYDSARRRIVLFGGHRTENGARIRLGDTWEWDGQRWEQTSTDGPSPRNGAAMAYDAGRGRVVLFGGSGGPSADTWEWDGRTWTRNDSAQTAGRFNSAMAYDPNRRAMIRFGGWDGAGRAGGTWRYDAAGWTRLDATGPSPRNHTGMVYDPLRETIVLFGGHDGPRVLGETWEWDGGAWAQRGDQTPRLRIDNGH